MAKVFNPYPYQQYCIDSIIYNRAVGLFLDMGLGKTVITLSAKIGRASCRERV